MLSTVIRLKLYLTAKRSKNGHRWYGLKVFESLTRDLREFAKEQIKCKNLVVGIAGKTVWGWGKRKVKRSFQYTLSSRSSRCVVIAIRFFANLTASIDSDNAARSGELLVPWELVFV